MNLQPIINTIAEAPHIICLLAIIFAMLAGGCIISFFVVLETLIDSKYGAPEAKEEDD